MHQYYIELGDGAPGHCLIGFRGKTIVFHSEFIGCISCLVLEVDGEIWSSCFVAVVVVL